MVELCQADNPQEREQDSYFLFLGTPIFEGTHQKCARHRAIICFRGEGTYPKATTFL